ncbi:hypothetical protein AB0C96_07200 [Streptomyces sp. NPDC048506]|uniref:hypothetical protein n=1 Tax=Streptomyces sp. NPDC048506 TaxID=3155028 RepID=UPI00342A231E
MECDHAWGAIATAPAAPGDGTFVRVRTHPYAPVRNPSVRVHTHAPRVRAVQLPAVVAESAPDSS